MIENNRKSGFSMICEVEIPEENNQQKNQKKSTFPVFVCILRHQYLEVKKKKSGRKERIFWRTFEKHETILGRME